ncbi:MAG: PLP-dependent aminotransferase family protein [Pseudomonadota bacterium]
MDTNWAPDLTAFPGPKYQGLSRALREAIRAGDLPPGAQLPTVRDLAWRLHLTPGTVARAYTLATQEGLLAATVGRGTFVAAQTPRLGPTQSLYVERDQDWLRGRLDLRSPQLPDLGQDAEIEATLAETAGQGGWLDYTSQKTELTLRAAVCDWLCDRVLGPIGPEDIALTMGGQNAVLMIMLCCLRGDRPVVLIEDLAYPGFRYAARLARADVVGVEMDNEGIVPSALEAACRRQGPQILCLTAEAQNPTTARMSEERRAEIARIARTYDLQIIEDDCYTVAESSLPSLRALASERTWYVGSLSKTVSAAMRFGYVVCPVGMGEAGRLTVQHSCFALAKPVADVALRLLSSGVAADMRARVQADGAVRLAIMVNRLGAFDLGWQPGLPFVWLRLPQGWRASTFTRMADGEGVLLRSADEYALNHGRAPNAVRMAISGRASLPLFDAGLGKLAALLAAPPSDFSV